MREGAAAAGQAGCEEGGLPQRFASQCPTPCPPSATAGDEGCGGWVPPAGPGELPAAPPPAHARLLAEGPQPETQVLTHPQYPEQDGAEPRAPKVPQQHMHQVSTLLLCCLFCLSAGPRLRVPSPPPSSPPVLLAGPTARPSPSPSEPSQPSRLSAPWASGWKR